MDSCDKDDFNSCEIDQDEEYVPCCKKRRLSDQTCPVSLISNETQEYTLSSDTDMITCTGDNSIVNGNEQSLSNKHDDSSKKGVTCVLDDIFEDMTADNIKASSKVTNNCQKQKADDSKKEPESMEVSSTMNDPSQRIEELSVDIPFENVNPLSNESSQKFDNGLTKADLCFVHKLTYTSDTQEYTLLSDSQDIEENTAKPHKVSETETETYAKSKDEGNIIVLDDSLEDVSVTKDASENSKGESRDAGLSCIKKAPSLVRDAKIIASIIPNVNFNIIYNKLLENRDSANRLDVVTTGLLETASTTMGNDLPKSARSVIEDVELVIKQFPTADADMVYAFLESIENESDRVDKTIKEMGLRKVSMTENKEKEKPAILKKKSTLIDDPVLASDPLFNDMRKVAKVFPDRDRNEIYALLEAHANRSDRIQIVMNELLREMPRDDADDKTNPNTAVESLPDGNSGNAAAVIDLTDFPAAILPEEEDVAHLMLLFPDCDPNYLFEKFETMKGVPDKRMVLAAELTENRNYPKLKDRLVKERLEEDKKKQIKKNFTVEEFLNKFPDPQTTFGNPTKLYSDAYKAHARACLLNENLAFNANFLFKTLLSNDFHFYKTSKKIQDILVQTPIAERRRHRHQFMKTRRKKLISAPTENDEYFFHEHWFTHNELKIEDYKKEKVLERRAKVEEAREKGELYECCCCFDDECLFEDLANCPEGHLFCKVCVVRSTEAAFGAMKIRFPCLTGECDQDIPLSTLQGIIPPNLFSKIVSRLQEEEVLQAQIPDLVTCPFCPFATIMPDPDDKILKCLNPECLRESCRLCREESHIPLKCNEVESRASTNMRTYIENKVAEAVMRKCHKCGKRFLKDTGCNKMTCVCGASSCYFCKEPNIDYSHFNKNKKCAQTDPNKIHERDMEEAAKTAIEEYILEHPEAADLDLQSEFKDIMKNYEPSTTKTIDNSQQYQDESSTDSEGEVDEEDYY